VGPAYFLAIGSAVLYGAADFTGGVATRRASTTAVVVLSQSCGLVLIALLLPLLPHAEPSRSDLLWGAAAGLTGGIGVALLYHALAIGSMTVVAPTTAVCAVTIPAGVSILLGERPAPMAVAGILLGIASIVLVSRQPVDPAASRTEPPRFLPRGVGIALISGVAIGLFLLTFAQTRPQAGMWPLLAARVVSVSLFAVIVLVRRGSLRMPARVAGLSLAGGAVDMLANALYLVAARLGPLSVVVTLSSLYPASTVLLARAILGERLGRWQILGVGCALTAIVLIIGGSR